MGPVARAMSTTITLIAVALLTFVLWMGWLSGLYHFRAQHTAYQALRTELALGVAPTGQIRPIDFNRPDLGYELLPLGTPVALLEIPALGMREVVFEGTTSGVLQEGPGHLRSTVMPGQAGVSVIMGRAATFGGPFGELGRLVPGDKIIVTSGQGVSKYRVLGVRRVGDPLPPPMAQGQGRLLLSTADGPPFLPSGVLRVDADLIGPAFETPTQVLGPADLAPAETALAGDPSAWISLVLWGQALLLAVCLLAWARARWGRWQIWLVSVPIVVYFGLNVADQASRLLPNLM
jgi:hypothetical protein